MPKDQASDEGPKSWAFCPYPPLVNTHDGRIGVSRAGPSSRTGLLEPRLHAPQLSSTHGSPWTQYPPTHSDSSIHPTEITALFQRAPTGSQPPQSAPMVNVVDQRPLSEKPRGGSRNPEAINFRAVPSVYDVYAQVPPSCSPHPPVETYPVFDRSASAGWVQDSGAFTSNLPLPPTLAAPPAPPAQPSVEDPSQLRSSSMAELPLSFMYNPYIQPSPFDLSGMLPDPSFTPSSSWEWVNQFLHYPDINTEPQPPAASVIDIPAESSFEWTAKDLELLSNPSLLTSTYVPSAQISSTQSYIPPQLPPQPPDKHLLRDPQHQWSYFGDYAQPGQVAKAPVSLEGPSVDNTARSGRLFLQKAHHFQMGDLNHFEAPNATHVTKAHAYVTNNTVITSKPIDGWKILRDHTAPNALHNSSARYDAPKCDKDTRVEVTAEIMEYIKDRAHPQRILCMTGAAGSGKSALQQSIAELCAEDNILGGAYFISAADTSRNTGSTIIPTIAYQLGLKHLTLQGSIAAAVEHDPLIFSQSLETQMDVLIARPFESMRSSRECDIASVPYAILIDGLDECQGEAIPTTDPQVGHANTLAKYRAEDRQAELLSAIKNSLLNRDLPLRIFIASRPEWAIHTALGAGGSLHGLAYHIPLSDKYDATEDMRRYLRRRFEDIGLKIKQPHWFTEGDIDTLVRAGSGQFVYVAIVYKYVSERRASHAHSLNTVLNWTPEQVTRPFEALDMLYRNILLSAKEAYEAVDIHSGRDFLLLFKIYLLDPKGLTRWGYTWGGGGLYDGVVAALLGLETDALEVLTLDLRSVVCLKEPEDEPGSWHLIPYHKSLWDFMDEQSRSKDLFVPVSPNICSHLAKCSMQRIIEFPEPELYTPNLVDWTDHHCASFSKRCVSFAIYHLNGYLPQDNDDGEGVDDEIVDFTEKGGWDKIDTVIRKHSGFEVIFIDWEISLHWAKSLAKTARVLRERRPEAGRIMAKYAKRWLHIASEQWYEDDTTDCSAE